ncbi:MAG: TolC family protein [Treponema sp.]|jgi:outer membrane protein TolC|nr:TolC family protein [Treponema sp.]
MSGTRIKQRTALAGILALALCPRLNGESLTLEEIRESVLANSRSLAQYHLAVQSAALDERAQTYTYLPALTLGASASISLWDERPLSNGTAQPEGTPAGERFGTALSFGVSQKVWDGGKHLVLRAINALNSEITRKEALAAYYAALEAADSACFAALRAEAALESADSALEKAVLALSLAELRLDAGMIRQGEYLEALAEKENRETGQKAAERELRLCRAKLSVLTGVRDAKPLPVDFAEREALIQRLADLDAEEAEGLYRALLKTAAARNPDLARSGLYSRQAGASLSLAKRDYVPTLNAGFSTGLQYSPSGGFSLSGGRFSLSGSIPLDFPLTGVNVAKKRLVLEEAKLQYLNAESSLELDLQTAFLDALTQAGQTRSSRRALDYADRHFAYVQELFTLSQNSLSALLDAAALVSANRNQLINAQYGFLSALSRLRSLAACNDDGELSGLLLGPSISQAP